MRKERRRDKKMKGRISMIGSYAIASSIKDHHHQRPSITCTTFNILAPIYKRLSQQVRFLLSFSFSIFHLPSIIRILTDPWMDGCKTGSQLPRKRLQDILASQKPENSRLALVWEIFHYLPSGLDFFFFLDRAASIHVSFWFYRFTNEAVDVCVLFSFQLWPWAGILGWKRRTCKYIRKQTPQCRLYQFQACSDQ